MSPLDEKHNMRPAASADDDPDYTMLSRRWNGVELINSDTALELARRVHAASYGAAHLAANEPLEIREIGNNWLIVGSKPGPEITPDRPLDLSQSQEFPFAMKISKFDGQILSYLFVLPAK